MSRGFGGTGGPPVVFSRGDTTGRGTSSRHAAAVHAQGTKSAGSAGRIFGADLRRVIWRKAQVCKYAELWHPSED
jgi:hypothetical protein